MKLVSLNRLLVQFHIGDNRQLQHTALQVYPRLSWRQKILRVRNRRKYHEESLGSHIFYKLWLRFGPF